MVTHIAESFNTMSSLVFLSIISVHQTTSIRVGAPD